MNKVANYKYKCTCTCNYTFTVDEMVRYGNPKCPECGKPASKVVKVTEVDPWDVNLFTAMGMLAVGLVAAFCVTLVTGIPYVLTIPVLMVAALLIGVIGMNYMDDRKERLAEEKAANMAARPEDNPEYNRFPVSNRH